MAKTLEAVVLALVLVGCGALGVAPTDAGGIALVDGSGETLASVSAGAWDLFWYGAATLLGIPAVGGAAVYARKRMQKPTTAAGPTP